ncbi:MAG: Phage capsid family protein [Bacteroidetes bacterium ADurb.BinA104]|nr:MAG: Phage capsid family protein [Bacteroidetes bacterium ADurb.BinA104]
MTLFELKEKLATMNAAIKADADWIAEKAADPTVPMEEIKAKTTHRDELTERRNLLQEQHDAMEAAQKAALASHPNTGNPEKDNLVKSKAAYYRAAATGEDRSKVYSGLGAIPAGSADLGSGSNLLPSVLANDLIAEPFEENSLRRVEQTSQIAGLEEPRIAFSIDDEDLLEDVVDFDTATEIETSADLVTYGRYKTKVKIEVADTVVYGTDTNLVTTVENGLKSALARKEKLRAFAKSADDAHKHMSFYMNGIKGITGTTIVAAIMAALGDLPDIFRANAKVVMRSADWYTYIQTLANSSDTLFTAKPQDVLGVPVEFNDQASIPIVGDFNYAKQNYEPVAVLDSDKDVDKGVYKYVLTAWGDHQIKLKSAFRLATTALAVIGGVATKSLNAISAVGTFNGEAPSSGITYLWQKLVGTTWTDTNSAYTGYNTDTLTVDDDGADAGVSFRCKITYSDASAYTNVIKIPAA